jgi:hypothetical protein
VGQALRTNFGAIKASPIISALIVAAVLVSITGGMASSASLLKNRGELYAGWLERR